MAALTRGHFSNAALAPSVLSKKPFGAAKNMYHTRSACETFEPVRKGPEPAGRDFSTNATFSGSSSSNHFFSAASFSVASAMPLTFWKAALKSTTCSQSMSICAVSTGLAPAKPNSRAKKRSMLLDCDIFTPSTSRMGSLPSDTSKAPEALASSNSGRMTVLKSPGVPKERLKRSSTKSTLATLNSQRESSATPRMSKYVSL
mmetsp:Transcript_61030/g.142167  ORF Transcript_61030/g.142167 Transcript_61030/m.142167 type:complete len:202 (-) Transcript_61030:83-688(-)